MMHVTVMDPKIPGKKSIDGESFDESTPDAKVHEMIRVLKDAANTSASTDIAPSAPTSTTLLFDMIMTSWLEPALRITASDAR